MNLAIIMDGNGRWAKQRLKMRTFGHRAGAENIEKITAFCAKSEVKTLLLYAFSTENWKRPKKEVDFLMQLLSDYLESKRDLYFKHNIVFKVIGNRSIFSQNLQEKIATLEQSTANFNGLTQILALNYGSKDELKRAFLTLQEKQDKKEITEDSITKALDFPQSIDMLIRTGGEQRLSNFLLWQCAYAELFFTNTLWPDFSTDELETMLKDFKKRERRFGGA